MSFFTCIGLIIIIYYLFYLVVLYVVDCDITLVLAEKFGKKRSKLRGKIIWITEADNDVGEALACEIAENNGKMILSAPETDRIQMIKDKCLKINSALKPDDIMILPMELANTESHRSCFKCILQHFGLIDIMVASGGKTERAIWEDIEVSNDRKLFESNVFGTISLARIAVNYFTNKGKGQIVVISSLGGVVGVPYSSTHAAGAHALHGYFESLRNEKLGTSLQVTLLCLGPVSSKLHDCNGKKQTSIDEKWRMSAGRYARLSVIAIVNKLDEAWMAPPPIIPLIYTIVNFPNVARIITEMIRPRKFKWLINSEIN